MTHALEMGIGIDPANFGGKMFHQHFLMGRGFLVGRAMESEHGGPVASGAAVLRRKSWKVLGYGSVLARTANKM